MARIAIVDDKDILRDSLTATLTREDHEVTAFADPTEALTEARTGRFDLILSDLKMPRMDGLALVRELRQAGVETPVIIMTAYGTVSNAIEAMKLGVFDFVQKPFDAEAIGVTIERALEHARLASENEALRESLAEARGPRVMLGHSPAMTELRDRIERVAASQATVLITGESGTGKELVAATIHQLSDRRDRPMLCVNCAALSASLLESELFGHERGAFTGADRTRKGRFEIADGGTLLLDEISEMEPALQAKLLRVLQEGTFERVGSSVTRTADVRVIATTNRDLREWAARGRFREDLYYRLNVLPVTVPALRERQGDVPTLVESFLQRAAAADGRATLTIEPTAVRMLEQYGWPGNVRELENLCRRAVTLCTGKTLTTALIAPWLTQTVERDAAALGLREGHLLEDMERKLILQTLERFNGHREKSARCLGMGVRTLTMKLKKWREERAMEWNTVAAVSVPRPTSISTPELVRA